MVGGDFLFWMEMLDERRLPKREYFMKFGFGLVVSKCPKSGWFGKSDLAGGVMVIVLKIKLIEMTICMIVFRSVKLPVGPEETAAGTGDIFAIFLFINNKLTLSTKELL